MFSSFLSLEIRNWFTFFSEPVYVRVCFFLQPDMSHPFLQTWIGLPTSPRRPVFDCVGGGVCGPTSSIFFATK